MNPFEAHGIERLSPSSINLFCSSPALWVLERVLKRTVPAGAAMQRGIAVEDGIVAGLHDASLTPDACIAAALSRYRSLTALSPDPRRESEGELIAGMVTKGLEALKPYGPPSRVQNRIERRFEGLSVPVLGFSDAEWDDYGIVLDIKSVGRMPSAIKPAHARQVAFYTGSDNLSGRVCYVTDKKKEVYQLENQKDHLDALHKIALTIQRFLSVSKDSHELVGIVAPDYDSFYFNHNQVRQNAFETWGF